MSAPVLGPIAGLILAGGQATRFGGIQKALADLGSSRLIDLVLDRLTPQVDAIAISANKDLKTYRALGHPVLTDVISGHLGPLAGIHAGLVWGAQSGYSHVLSVAGDTPFIPSNLASHLSAGLDSKHAIAMAARGDGKHRLQPTIALWPTILADDLGAALQADILKIVLWAEPHGIAAVSFDQPGDNPFFNVNTPQDLDVAKAKLRDMRT